MKSSLSFVPSAPLIFSLSNWETEKDRNKYQGYLWNQNTLTINIYAQLRQLCNANQCQFNAVLQMYHVFQANQIKSRFLIGCDIRNDENRHFILINVTVGRTWTCLSNVNKTGRGQGCIWVTTGNKSTSDSFASFPFVYYIPYSTTVYLMHKIS